MPNSSTSKLQLIQQEHKCSGCLCLELEGKLIEPTPGLFDRIPFVAPNAPAADPEIDLYLTIQFNEQWETLPGGGVKFGLRGGELRLKLRNGAMPLG